MKGARAELLSAIEAALPRAAVADRVRVVNAVEDLLREILAELEAARRQRLEEFKASIGARDHG